jgi:hypothetical protein
MKVLSPNTFRSPVYRVYAHLSDEERLDQACELLAEGVLRLAEQRGLLKDQKTSAPQAPAKAKETT